MKSKIKEEILEEFKNEWVEEESGYVLSRPRLKRAIDLTIKLCREEFEKEKHKMKIQMIDLALQSDEMKLKFVKEVSKIKEFTEDKTKEIQDEEQEEENE